MVAAPPKDNVVAVVLKMVAVVVEVVISAEVAPLTARSPVTVTSPSEVSSAMENKVLVPSVKVKVPVLPMVTVGEAEKARSTLVSAEATSSMYRPYLVEVPTVSDVPLAIYTP